MELQKLLSKKIKWEEGKTFFPFENKFGRKDNLTYLCTHK